MGPRVRLTTIVACLFVAACSNEPTHLRVWTPDDHAHPPDTQIDPNRVPQRERTELTVGDADIARTITAGKAPNMPAFAEVLTPSQISDLVAHIRTWTAEEKRASPSPE